MDYEKKYKEALELARVAAFNGHQSLMEGIFPELKESEDEKTRKEIIYYLKNQPAQTIGTSQYESWIAWLKKQGKKKSAWSKDDEYRVEILYALCEEEMNKSLVISTAFREMQETRNWLHSLKERIGGEL